MLNETVRHYDIEVDFFKRFLDPYMKYTSGLYYSAGDGLDCASQQMLDQIIEVAGICSGKSVLEIGPGWGALLRRMHEKEIESEYVGVSPSAKQNNYIREFARSGEHLVTSTFEQFYSAKKYDIIVLLGSFCHLKNQLEQLIKMKSMLAEGGRIVVEDTFFISLDSYGEHKNNEATKYLQDEIFGYAKIYPLSMQIEKMAAAGLKLTYLFEHSSSYKSTIDEWLKRLKSLDGTKFPQARPFVKYLQIAQKGWNVTTQNHLMALEPLPGL